VPAASNKKSFDRTSISFAEEYAVSYWTNSLSCTPEALRAAVRAVGYSADAVKMHLKKK
jgi:hypothetical protein